MASDGERKIEFYRLGSKLLNFDMLEEIKIEIFNIRRK